MVNKQQKTSQFLKTKERSQATTIENLRSETGWQIHTFLIEQTECMSFWKLGGPENRSLDMKKFVVVVNFLKMKII